MLAILAMGGGLFVPLQNLPPVMRTIAQFSPAYGVGVISRAPLVAGCRPPPSRAWLGGPPSSGWARWCCSGEIRRGCNRWSPR